MPPCYLDEWRLVVVELNVGAKAGGSEWSSLVWQRRGQLAGGAASQEAPPLTCLLEHPLWRLAGSMARWRRQRRAGSTVEAPAVRGCEV
jgi:hypothetical protein